MLVLMGSGAQTARETVAPPRRARRAGRRAAGAAVPAVPDRARCWPRCRPRVRRVAVLDRTKEPGSLGEPLFLDVLAALAEAHSAGDRAVLPTVIGGRYGLGSKEFTPGMVAGVFAELARDRPRPRFTIGITDDVAGTSLPYDPALDIEPPQTVRAVFFGLGSDGTVGANKNTIKILGADPRLHAQGYFVYDSKKSGSQTVSHLRFGPAPDPGAVPGRSRPASSAATTSACWTGSRCWTGPRPAPPCCSTARIRRRGLGDAAPPGAGADPRQAPRRVRHRRRPGGRARRGCAGRTNTVLQTCFFAISGVLPRDEAIDRDQGGDHQDVRPARRRRGRAQPRRRRPDAVGAAPGRASPPGDGHPRACRRSCRRTRRRSCATVTATMMAGRGDDLPVSALPVDGTYPSGTTAFEKRNISDLVAVWDPDLCIQCGNCSFVCPHSVIRSKFYDQASLDGAPAGFPSMPLDGAGPAGHPLHPSGLPGGLHRLRAVRGGLPGPGARRPGPQGDQPRTAGAAAGRRRGRPSRSSRRCRSTTGPGWTSAPCAAPSILLAAVRVLRRLRRLRRDARTSRCCPSSSATGS